MIHLEGMGILGCYCALNLAGDGVDFTWSDTEDPVNAWTASTGAIFPTGHAEDLEALAVWETLFLHDEYIGRFMERAAFVFGSKAPPHEGKQLFQDFGPVRRSVVDSLHLNAQEWVPATRQLLADRRRTSAARGQQVVITHGFGPRLARYMWGWTVPVKVETEGDASSDLREALYFRRGRFVMAYAYPIPGTDTWYAGSSLLHQRVPKLLDVDGKYKHWRQTFVELADGYVLSVRRAGRPMQAWRPVPAEGDTAWVTELEDGRLALRPLWHSGIRHAPLVYNALCGALNL